jgi:hypothetical protein
MIHKLSILNKNTLTAVSVTPFSTDLLLLPPSIIFGYFQAITVILDLQKINYAKLFVDV